MSIRHGVWETHRDLADPTAIAADASAVAAFPLLVSGRGLVNMAGYEEAVISFSGVGGTDADLDVIAWNPSNALGYVTLASITGAVDGQTDRVQTHGLRVGVLVVAVTGSFTEIKVDLAPATPV